MELVIRENFFNRLVKSDRINHVILRSSINKSSQLLNSLDHFVCCVSTH